MPFLPVNLSRLWDSSRVKHDACEAHTVSDVHISVKHNNAQHRDDPNTIHAETFTSNSFGLCVSQPTHLKVSLAPATPLIACAEHLRLMR